MSDVSQALQHGAPSEANKNKIVIKKKTLNNCIRKLRSRNTKGGSIEQVLRGIRSQVASQVSSKDSSVSHGLKIYSDESLARYIASNSVLQTSFSGSKVLTSLNKNQIDIQAHDNFSLNGRARNQKEKPSHVRRPQMVDATQKMRMRLRQLEQSKDFQLRANMGVCSVANNSLIDMGIDKKRNVSKNIFSKNNLPIQMEQNEGNDQLETYRKANKILSDQLKELREYVDTVKAYFKFKF